MCPPHKLINLLGICFRGWVCLDTANAPLALDRWDWPSYLSLHIPIPSLWMSIFWAYAFLSPESQSKACPYMQDVWGLKKIFWFDLYNCTIFSWAVLGPTVFCVGTIFLQSAQVTKNAACWHPPSHIDKLLQSVIFSAKINSTLKAFYNLDHHLLLTALYLLS